MFRCHQCDLTVFTTRCPKCGQSRCVQDEATAGFVEYLRIGKSERQEAPPRPYRQRLATYLQRDEAEVMSGVDSPASTMPLRILSPIGPQRGPRPPWLIRFVLNRVRQFAGIRRRGRRR